MLSSQRSTITIGGVIETAINHRPQARKTVLLIIILCLEIDTGKVKVLREYTQKFVQEIFEMEVKVKLAYKLGKKLCLVELDNFQVMMKIMNYKLRYDKNR